MTMLRPILRYDGTEGENIRNLTLTMQALSGGLRQCCIVVRFLAPEKSDFKSTFWKAS